MATKAKRKLMSNDPITLATLTQFHRDVLLPDMQRIVAESETRLERRMDAQLDAIFQRFDRLETEYHMLVAGLKRVEERLDRVEGRLDRVELRLDGVEQRLGAVERKLDKVALRSELDELRARVDVLQQQIRALEERLSA